MLRRNQVELPSPWRTKHSKTAKADNSWKSAICRRWPHF